jgi:hypothetical protein
MTHWNRRAAEDLLATGTCKIKYTLDPPLSVGESLDLVRVEQAEDVLVGDLILVEIDAGPRLAMVISREEPAKLGSDPCGLPDCPRAIGNGVRSRDGERFRIGTGPESAFGVAHVRAILGKVVARRPSPS